MIKFSYRVNLISFLIREGINFRGIYGDNFCSRIIDISDGIVTWVRVGDATGIYRMNTLSGIISGINSGVLVLC